MNDFNSPQRSGTLFGITTTGLVAAAATAALVATSTRRTEREHPPQGRFVDVSGVRVHYREAGNGPPVVLVHGNALDGEDFIASGLVASLASNHRVVVIDRPGFGFTKRPRGTSWTPARQADLLHDVLGALSVLDPIVVGHSLGSLVVAAFGLAYPREARALVLLSGYYYNTAPLGLSPFAFVALPVVSDVLSYTVSPVSARLLAPAMKAQMFAPSAVTPSFEAYPLAMSRRPAQLRATVNDANAMHVTASKLEARYGELAMLPVEIVAGDGDVIVDTNEQSARLAQAIPAANFELIPHAGHMIHHIAPDRVLAAIARAGSRSQHREPFRVALGPEDRDQQAAADAAGFDVADRRNGDERTELRT